MPLFRKNPEKSVFRSLNEGLRAAAARGDVPEVRELMRRGAKFVPDKEGRTALHIACVHGHSELVRELIEYGCDVNYQDKLGYTPVHRACLEGHAEVVRILLDVGAEADHQDVVQENTALHDVAFQGYSSSMELLLQARANIYIRNKRGATALHLCCQNGHNQCCKILLARGCKLDVKDKYDDTPLHTACRYLHAGVTKLLLSAKMGPNEPNKNGDTALHLACNLGQKKLVRLLLQYGASPVSRNRQGESALDIAARKQMRELTEILSQTSPSKILPTGQAPWKCRREKVREKFQSAREQGSSWQLLFQDSPPDADHSFPTRTCFVDGVLHKNASAACPCIRTTRALAKDGLFVQRQLFEEVDDCHEDLAHEISDLRHSTHRKIQHLNLAVRKLGTNVQRATRRQAIQAARAAKTPVVPHRASPSRPPKGGSSRAPDGKKRSSQQPFQRARLVRSKSESELETDVEREHRSFAAESDGSVSNLSDDLYIDPELHLSAPARSPDKTQTLGRRRIRFREPRVSARYPEPLIEVPGEGAPESTSSLSSLERHAEPSALIKQRYEITAKKFDMERDSNSFQESSCTTPNSHNYTTHDSESSARNSISSFQSNMSASQLSHTQSFQQSLDSGYGTASNGANPLTAGSPAQFNPQTASPSLDSGMPESPSYARELRTGSSSGSMSPEMIAMRRAVNKRVPQISRVEAETQTDSCTDDGDCYSEGHEYTEVESTAVANRRVPPKLTIPPPPTKPLPPLPPARTPRPAPLVRVYASRTVGPPMSTNV